MSKIFKSIADYQSDRYQQQTKLLKRTQDIIDQFSTGTSLQAQQTQLNEKLDHLVQLAQSLKSDRKASGYKGLSSNIERFRNTMIQNPFTTNQFDYYGTSGSFGTSYANRYQEVNNNNVAVQNIKSEIRSFKGMLLSRRNFPTIASPVNPVSKVIPSTTPTQQQVPVSPTKAATTPGSPVTVDQPVYHPRIGRKSVRAELAPTTTTNTQTTVEEVKEDTSAST